MNISNSAPIINLIEGGTIYACEGELFNYPFNITDYDDDLDFSSLTMTPISPLKLKLANLNRLVFAIFGSRFYTGPFIFDKNEVGSYPKTVSVSDYFLADSKDITIQVLETNNVPVATAIGVHLVYKRGHNTSFNYEWFVSDAEDGLSSDGNLFDKNDNFGVLLYSYNLDSKKLTKIFSRNKDDFPGQDFQFDVIP